MEFVLYIPLVYEGGQSGLTYKIRIRAESNGDQIRPEVILNGRENDPHLSGWTWKGWDDRERPGKDTENKGKDYTACFPTLLICQMKPY